MSEYDSLSEEIPSMTTSPANEDNKENVTLIWFNPDTDKIPNFEEVKRDLRAESNLLLCPRTIDSCIAEIKARIDDKIILIAGEERASELPQDVINHHQLDSVFIFPQQTNQSNSSSIDSTKVVGTFEDVKQLIGSVQQTTKLIDKQMEVASFYDKHQRGTRDLSEQSAEFLWFQLFKNVIHSLPHDDQAKQEMLTVSRDYYQGNGRILKDIDKFEKDYREEDCIYWYTKNTFVYKLINRALRTEDIEQLYVFRYYIGDLSAQLLKRFQSLKNGRKKQIVLYRGTVVNTKELERFKANIGQTFAINNYWSTSYDRATALTFATTPRNLDEKTVLFIIDCNLDKSNNSAIFANISVDSEFPCEKEYLFDAGSILQIKAVKEEKDGDSDLYVVQMGTSGEGRETEQQYIDAIDREIEYESPRIMLGILLKRIGKYQKSLRYFEKLLEEPGEEKLAHIHNRIGIALKLQHKPDPALEHFDKAHELTRISNPAEPVYLAFILHNQGQIFSTKKNFFKALQCYENAVTIIQKEIPEENRYLADYYTCIGRVYSHQGNYERAMYYQKEALRVRKVCLPPEHVLHAFSYVEIANIFSSQQKYNEALEYHLEALKLRKTFLLSNHLNTAWSLYYVGKMYHGLLDSKTALDYYNKALEMKRKCLSDSNPYITPNILQDMAMIYGYDSPKALDYLLEALDIQTKAETVHISSVAHLLDQIIFVYKSTNRKEDLLLFYERALGLRIKYLHKDKRNLAHLLDDIALIYKSMNSEEDVLKFSLRALKIRRDFLPNDKSNLARLLDDINNMFKLSKTKEGYLEFCETALDIRENVLYHDKFNLTRLLDDIGFVYKQMGRTKDSLQYYERSLQIREENLNEVSFNLSYSFKYLASIHEKQHHLQDALYYYGELLRIYEHYYDYDHPSCEKTRKSIKRVQRRFR